MRELPPPASVTAEEKTVFQEVALSSAEPEELSLVLESAACAAKARTLANLSEREDEAAVEQAALVAVAPSLSGLRVPSLSL